VVRRREAEGTGLGAEVARHGPGFWDFTHNILMMYYIRKTFSEQNGVSTNPPQKAYIRDSNLDRRFSALQYVN